MKLFARVAHKISGFILVISITACATVQVVTDPLPSWSEGDSKQRIIEFVNAVSDGGGSDYVAPNERIATFDNDGTLWSEKPAYFQLLFVLDRVRSMAADHPEWAGTFPFNAVLENDFASLQTAKEHDWNELFMATQAGMTTEDFESIVSDWLDTARHPTTGRAYTDMVFQPMLELLDYLRDNQFKVFIVSGGGLAFMRPWTEAVYGIPPEQVVGSSIETEYEVHDGKPVIKRIPKMHFINDKETKPIAINRFIGRRPVFAAGNSDGDFQMLEWTTSGEGRRFGLLVHHTDAEREWAYDRNSSTGRLDRGLDDAKNNGWLVVDMARDWRVIYPDNAGDGTQNSR